MRISKNLFFDPVLSGTLSIDQPERRNSGLNRSDVEFAIALFFREEAGAIRDNQPHVARAGHINPGKINLIQNAVA